MTIDELCVRACQFEPDFSWEFLGRGCVLCEWRWQGTWWKVGWIARSRMQWSAKQRKRQRVGANLFVQGSTLLVNLATKAHERQNRDATKLETVTQAVPRAKQRKIERVIEIARHPC